MKKLILLPFVLAACAGGPGGTTGGTGNANCGTADAACTTSAQCCSGFGCAGGVCVFQDSGIGSGGNSVTGSSTGSQCTAGHCSTSSDNASGAGGNPSSAGGNPSSSSGHQTSTGGSGGHTSSSGSTSGGHDSTSSSSSSSTGGTTGACVTMIDTTEFVICGTGQATCDSPLNCVSDPPFNVTDCEYPCHETSDCPDPTTICSGGNCVNDLCGPIGAGGSIVNSAFDAPCNAAGSKDGVCLAFLLSDAGTDLGLCLQAGSSENGCNAAFSPRCTGSSAFCVAGFVCGPWVSTSLPATCVEACDPNVSSTCPGGAACTGTGDGYTGTCPAPASGGTTGGGSSGGTGGGLCTTCSQDSDCAAGGFCVSDSDGFNLYCGTSCTASQGCPAADPCQSETDADGVTTVSACYPSDGTCDGI